MIIKNIKKKYPKAIKAINVGYHTACFSYVSSQVKKLRDQDQDSLANIKDKEIWDNLGFLYYGYITRLLEILTENFSLNKQTDTVLKLLKRDIDKLIKERGIK